VPGRTQRPLPPPPSDPAADPSELGSYGA
jgi:hypothetical protein